MSYYLNNNIILFNSKLFKKTVGGMSTSKIYRGKNILLHQKQSGKGGSPRFQATYIKNPYKY